MQNKPKKFESDTHDYQYNRVYTWADERAKYRKKFTKRRTNMNDTERLATDSDSQLREELDSSTYKSKKNRRPFLGKSSDTSVSSNEGAEGGRTLRCQNKPKKVK